ncbi:MAG: [protein-PII] uridylyltransferase [Nevskiales bacterium]
MAESAPDLFAQDLLRQLRQIAAQALTAPTLKNVKAALAEGQAELSQGFDSGAPAEHLVHARAVFVDQILTAVWALKLGVAQSRLALVAVGGYGRGELLPHSDIDLLILHPAAGLDGADTAIHDFLSFLWDIGLEVGHSVRSPADCATQAAGDLTVMTNLLEARRLAGAPALYAAMEAALAPSQIWPVREFYHAKLREQRARHTKYDDSGYKLEPNVKESPGGLRDIQIIAWVAKRHFNARELHDLVRHGFLSEDEYQDLAEGQEFLWRVRFALHTLTERREDRLLFDYQVKLAKLFGYSDQSHSLAVEQFMQRYYSIIKGLFCLNDLLLQLFDEAILHPDERTPAIPINRRFQSRHGYIEVTHPEVFHQTPYALFELFYLMQQDSKLSGIRAETLRLLRRDRHLIEERFRADIRARSFFMEMLRTGNGLTRALRRMNRYGLLGRYIPAFGQVIGRMQYDLFHTLTVDEHTLFVVRNMRRLAMQRFAHELPYCTEVMKKLPKPELLYLAGMFHDIAKGRGGDHSELGAEDARQFCLGHGLSGRDSELVSWLVRHHLVMSMTAQRKDISDPAVIHEFAVKVGNPTRLDYLFLMTVSDIRATNPKLWNAWRESLLTTLYKSARRNLERGLENPLVEQELIQETRDEARELLRVRDLAPATIDAVWARFAPDIFRRHSAQEIVWFTEAIHGCRDEDLPLVLVDTHSEMGTAVFVYTRDVDYLFGLLTGVLAQLGLSIHDARIASTLDRYTLDTYIVTEADNSPITEATRPEEIRQALRQAIRSLDYDAARVTRRASRLVRHFSVPTQVHFSQDAERQRTVMELVAADRPGLLSAVGATLRKHQILVEDAKINTIGERAEDIFFVTDHKRRPLTDSGLFNDLRQELIAALDYEGTV